jgi:hypothetical protein
LLLQDAESNSGNSMIIIHAKHVTNKRTARLFSIVHQPEKSYPVTIQPEEEESLPEFLKKSYYSPSSQSEIEQTLKGLGNRLDLQKRNINLNQVVNRWVSDTPSEFRKNLSDAFNLSIVKREILNLASSTGISVNENISSVNNANEDLDDKNL